MSEYIHFFIRGNDGFYPIGTFSRSNFHYKYFHRFAPYEKVAPLSAANILQVYYDVKRDAEECEETIKKYKETIKLIASMEGSIEERISYITEYQNDIASAEQMFDLLHRFQGFVDFLSEIVGVAQDFQYEESLKSIGSDRYVYVGIETGYDITDDMIEEE